MYSKKTDNNYLSLIQKHIQKIPDKIALHLPQENQGKTLAISYEQLGERINSIQMGLMKAGFKENDRVIILFPVSLDLYALILALLGLNMTAVFIDISMSFQRVLYSIKTSKAKSVISYQRFLKWRLLLKPLWSLELYSTDSNGFGLKSFSSLCVSLDNQTATHLPKVQACNKNQRAIITFTSGSTGKPKAADRNHHLLISQYHSLSKVHEVKVNSSCLSCFPVFVLYTVARGITTVLPNMDFRSPGNIDAELIVQQLQGLNINYIAAGPAFTQALCDFIISKNNPINSIEEVAVGGAPVSHKLAHNILKSFPKANASVGYGSTEAEPISHLALKTLLNLETYGNPVGYPVPDIEAQIVRIPDTLVLPSNLNTLASINLAQQRCNAGEVGELLLAGQQVLAHYLSPADDQRCKLEDENGKVWHRIGDLGYFQDDGLLVLVGRNNNKVIHDGKSLYPLMIETPLMNLAAIRFAAYLSLVVKGKNSVVLCLQLTKGFTGVAEQKTQLLAKIKAVFAKYSLSLPQLYCIDQMPVDGRHNSKIDRKVLIKQLQKRFFSPVKPCLLSNG